MKSMAWTPVLTLQDSQFVAAISVHPKNASKDRQEDDYPLQHSDEGLPRESWGLARDDPTTGRGSTARPTRRRIGIERANHASEPLRLQQCDKEVHQQADGKQAGEQTHGIHA